MNRFLVPLGGFLLLVVLLAVGLRLNPRDVPSPFIGKPAPAFDLPRLYQPDMKISAADMKGKVWILNVFASWCVSCRAEHAVVSAYARSSHLPVIGLNYKDEPADAKAWLAQLGNPYTAVAVDREGKTGIDWGVYGVPESFVVDKKGIIRHKFTGPIDAAAVEQVLKPLVTKLNQEVIQ
ncbi:MAG: DsbE family thiol:disulfide interchange protein [bacterium]